MYMGEAGEYAIVYLCKDHHDDRACAEPVVTAFGRTPEISDAARAVFTEHVQRLCLNLDDFKFYHHERESKRGVNATGVHVSGVQLHVVLVANDNILTAIFSNRVAEI